jgi:hypothetical protein
VKVWLDLIASPNNHLGKLEEPEEDVSPELAKQVIEIITNKYNPQVPRYF